MSVREARLNVRVSPQVKDEAKQVYESLGVDLSTAVTVFLKKSIAVGGFPFAVTTEKPNAVTMKAIKDSKKGIGNSKAYSDVDELWNDLNMED